MTTLEKSALHGSLIAPELEAIGFLNEVMDRFPDSISFAPGAPHAKFFADVDVSVFIERFRSHLAADKGLSRPQIDKQLYQYGPSKGIINQLVSDALLVDEGIAADPRSIVITTGCQEALLLVIRSLCATSNDAVAAVNPSFVGFCGAARLLDVPVLPVKEGAEGQIDWEGFEQTCRDTASRGKKLRALYVAPDYSNPSGSLLTLESRHRLLELARTFDFLLIEDNAYGFTSSPTSALPTLKSLDRHRSVVYVGTCAKVCMPGLRVGFAVADQWVKGASGEARFLADELATLKTMVTVNTSPICQAIVGGMLLQSDRSFVRLASEKAELYRRNLAVLLEALERRIGRESAAKMDVSWNAPGGGFFVRMRLPFPADVDLLEKCATSFGVLWTPMSYFHLDGGGSREIRLSCSYLSEDAIDEGVRRLAAFLFSEHAVRHTSQAALQSA